MKSMPKKSAVPGAVVSGRNDTERVCFLSSRNKDGSTSKNNDTGVPIVITSSMIHSPLSVCSHTR